MDEWCELTSCLTVFQSYQYQGDGWVIIKGCVQSNLVNDLEDSRLKRVSNAKQLEQQACICIYWHMPS